MHSRHKEQHVLRPLGRKEPVVFQPCVKLLSVALVLSVAEFRFLVTRQGEAQCVPGLGYRPPEAGQNVPAQPLRSLSVCLSHGLSPRLWCVSGPLRLSPPTLPVPLTGRLMLKLAVAEPQAAVWALRQRLPVRAPRGTGAGEDQVPSPSFHLPVCVG